LFVIERDSLGAEFLPQDLILLFEVLDHILLMPAYFTPSTARSRVRPASHST
jgi:hypothetical protein